MLGKLKDIILLIGAVLLALMLSPIIAVLVVWQAYKKWILRRRFLANNKSNGPRVLFVYSDSPNWQEYIEEYLLTKIPSHSVVFNLKKI